MPLQDLTGQRFGNLVAISFVGREKSKSIWLWLCDCGNSKEVWSSHVKEGRVKSCGCAILKARRNRPDWHGMTSSVEHRTWTNMITRCTNKKYKDWNNYGGRGISVCEEWFDFKKFYSDMGPRPRGMSIDRIDNDGNYCKDNCRWAYPKTQSDNRRVTHWVEHDDKKMTVTDWARHFNVTVSAIVKRMKTHGTLNGYKPYACAAKNRT